MTDIERQARERMAEPMVLVIPPPQPSQLTTHSSLLTAHCPLLTTFPHCQPPLPGLHV